MSAARRAGVLGAMLAALGCVHHAPLSIAEVNATHLAFVKDGATTREELLLRFGDPTGVFEDGRILTFRLEASEAGVVAVRREYDRDVPGVTQWRLANLSFVAVFDQDNVLRRHSLIPVKP